MGRWHRRKTEIYTGLVESGALPPRPGIARIAAAAYDAGWQLAVASTSAEPAVRSVLEHAVGPELAQHFSVFAGDIVPRKKPAPDIYELALDRLPVSPAEAVAIEDSANGMQAALGAGLACVVTTSSYTQDEDFTGAALVVTTLGDPPGPARRARGPGRRSWTGAAPPSAPTCTTTGRISMSVDPQLEFVVKTVAETAVEKEQEFGDLDAVVGDGDFGYSLARGFEIVVAEWDDLDRSSSAVFLQKVALVISKRVGGTSGPIWGTAFLRASAAVKDVEELTPEHAVAMLRAAAEGIKKRGNSDLGDKTLLDALIPMTDAIETARWAGPTPSRARSWPGSRPAPPGPPPTPRPRCSRSGGGRATPASAASARPDAGAVAVAVLAERVADRWPDSHLILPAPTFQNPYTKEWTA